MPLFNVYGSKVADLVRLLAMMVGLFLAFVLSALVNDGHGFLFGKDVRKADMDPKEQMLAGIDGIAVVDVGLADKLVVMKEKLYTCPDLEIKQSRVKCNSGYDKFVMRNPKDMCYGLRYSVSAEGLNKQFCISQNDQPTSLVKKNNLLICRDGSKSSEAALVSEINFNRICGKRITDPIRVVYFVKKRNDMPVIFKNETSIDCGFYSCTFNTYREVDDYIGVGAPAPFPPVPHYKKNLDETPTPIFASDTPSEAIPQVSHGEDATKANDADSSKPVDTDSSKLLDTDSSKLPDANSSKVLDTNSSELLNTNSSKPDDTPDVKKSNSLEEKRS